MEYHISFTNSTDKWLVQKLLLLTHDLKEPMSPYSIQTVPLPISIDTSLDSYVTLTTT